MRVLSRTPAAPACASTAQRQPQPAPGLYCSRPGPCRLARGAALPAAPRRSRRCLAVRTRGAAAPAAAPPARPVPPAPLRVVIAGAGISGLSLALGLLNKGYEVVVLERDLTAIRGEGKYRGPIQVRAGMGRQTRGGWEAGREGAAAAVGRSEH